MGIKNMVSIKKLKSQLINKGNLKKFFYFALIGGFGTILNTGILYLLSQKAGMNYLFAAVIATEIAIISNFVGNNYLTFKNQNSEEKIYKKFFSFQLISLITLFGTIFFLWLFVTMFGSELLLVWNLVAILIMFVANFVLNSAFTWKAKKIARFVTVTGNLENINQEKRGNAKGFNLNMLIFLLGIGILFSLLFLQSSLAETNSSVLIDNETSELNESLKSPMFVNMTDLTDKSNDLNTSQNSTESNESFVNESDYLEDTEEDTEENNEEDTEEENVNVSDNFTTTDNLTNTTNTTNTSQDSDSPVFNDTNSSNDLNSTLLNPINLTNNSSGAINLTNNSSEAIVSISQLGYHPSSIKQVVVYTDTLSGTFTIRAASTDSVVASFPLQIPKNYAGNDVNCQGNMPCLTGDFTSFTNPGTYYIEQNGINSPVFTIHQNIFSDTIPLFFEYFNAQLQQDSSYHNDFHSGYTPAFTSMSDGSFIMEADQAALPLIRLGSAYRRNPQLFQFDNYDILASDKPDTQEYILTYVEYLKGLQGVLVQIGNSPDAVRLGSGMLINNIFVPGPTDITSMNVYIPGTPPSLLQSAPVVSLCGENDGSDAWEECITRAATFYKCQIDEPCLNITYNDELGTISSDVSTNGYAVSKGWGYEFGCYFDVDLQAGGFNDGDINPCHIFYSDTNRAYTSMTLLAFLEAIPAVNDYSTSQAQELLTRSIHTYEYINNNYPSFIYGDSDAGFYGASLFLLYEYTNNSTYLQKAYEQRDTVSKTFISDATRGNEFYWEEYVRHKDAITALGFTYKFNGVNPEEFFRGKMYQDYKDAGPTAISNNGERVFQFDNDIQFQNSRYMLIEGLLGMKTTELVSNPESFISVVAQNQLSWLTGMNVVQKGVGLNAPVESMSFIFGIGNQPNQFHSRWLVNTGYTAASSGSIIGARGTGYQFFDQANNSYVYLDGVTTILGKELGAMGNRWHNESVVETFQVGQAFNNGKTYIPGWINGAFPVKADGDTIFNYNDDLDTYEFTESTNEIVGIAIEYFAYLDGDLNNKPRYAESFSFSNQTNNTNTTNSTNTTNNTNETNNTGDLHILTNPGLVNITINETPNTIHETSNTNGILNIYNLSTGKKTITATKKNHTTNTTQITITTGNNSINITLLPINQTPTNNTNNTNTTPTPKITSTSTSIPSTTINGTTHYSLREDDTSTFSVMSNMANNITWFIDGIEKNTTTGQNASFVWAPGILWSPRAPTYSNTVVSTVKAKTPTESVSWVVHVENVINPFFSSENDEADVLGSIDSKIHVLVNNKYLNFTHVNVTLSSDSGNTMYQLNKTFNNSNETEWTKYIPELDPGNNYLAYISGFNNITGQDKTYHIGLSRAHYVQSLSRSSKGGGGSSSSSSQPFNPELIYALFGKDVVNPNESQTLVLDTKNFNGGVYSVQAKLLTPQNTFQTLTLTLVNGTREYGTWMTTFKPTLIGEYSLYSVIVGASNKAISKEIVIQDHTFYYFDQNMILGDVSEELGLIYTVLSQSEVFNGTSVKLTLDARDPLGITSVSAEIEDTKQGNFSIPLKLVKGESTYGTWEGSFTVTMPDTTYVVRSITMRNTHNEKIHTLKDRSVYVFPVSNQEQITQNKVRQNRITGASIMVPFSSGYWYDIMKKPLVPSLVGFGIMFIVIIGTLFFKRK